MNGEREKSILESIECVIVSRLLNQYVDGRLSPAVTWRIKNHVVVCRSCSQSARTISSVTALLGSAVNHKPSSAFDASLEARIAGLQQTKPSSALVRYIRSVVNGTVIDPLYRRNLAGPVVAAAVSIAFFGIAFQHVLTVPTQPTQTAVVASPAAYQDPALIQTCVNQHRSNDGADPLDDTSAILLTSRVDTLPVAQNQNQNLSDDDAAVLLDEGM